jgi:GT2 family glycosyltransferase
MESSQHPPISVVICTRDRGDSITRTVRSILSSDYPSYSILVVDQSGDERTFRALKPFLNNGRLRYHQSPVTGLAAARNLGIEMAGTDLIAMTDDDCEVPPDWLTEMVSALTLENDTGIVFGNVLPGKHDLDSGFIPNYIRGEAFLARSILKKARIEGIGACMGLKLKAWSSLGGFDEALGAGSLFRSAEETDLTIRALLAGYHVFETPRVHVIHNGFRNWGEGKALIRGHLYGLGAMYAKLFKCGRWSVLPALSVLAWRWAFGRPVVDFGHYPPRWMRLASFLRGTADGVLVGVRLADVLFNPNGSSTAQPVTLKISRPLIPGDDQG